MTILARVFDNERGLLSRGLARSILAVKFSRRDKARMHDLAVGTRWMPSREEKEEVFAFAKAGTLLGIFKSKARRTLTNRPMKRINA